jgi:catechol 2,3-dioxygenase-like lactoylglutathione lyase family enzyme
MIKIEDVAFVRFRAPDLAPMRRFLEDFGLHVTPDSTSDCLRVRGTGTAPYLHITERGEAGFVSVGLRASSVEDLQRLAASEGVAVEPMDGDAGGQRVRLVDPNGHHIEVVAGQRPAEPLPEVAPAGWNIITERRRVAEPHRVLRGPATVRRLGHVVLVVNDAAASWEWWRDRFGIVMSDEVRTPDGHMVAAFMRCDRGSLPVDHHCLNFASAPGRASVFHHAAFEVTDLDNLITGHEHLKAGGHTPSWGIGRHILGSQVFDYWKDPHGNKLEHWTDGDVFDISSPTGVADIPTMLGHQWGPPAPADFV